MLLVGSAPIAEVIDGGTVFPGGIKMAETLPLLLLLALVMVSFAATSRMSLLEEQFCIFSGSCFWKVREVHVIS